MSYKSLFVEATKVRQLFQNRLIARPLLRRLYLSYNPEVEIETFLEHAEILFPKLNCGLTVVYLQYTLGEGNIRNGSYKGQGHTFLIVENTVMDITADQFGGPQVYAGPLILPWSLDKSNLVHNTQQQKSI